MVDNGNGNGKFQFETILDRNSSKDFMLNTDIELLFDVTFDAKGKATCVPCKNSCDNGLEHTFTSETFGMLPACNVASTYELTKSFSVRIFCFIFMLIFHED